MSSIHEVSEQFWSVEEDEGQWLLLCVVEGAPAPVGPFASAWEAAQYGQDHVDCPWEVLPLIRPEDWPGAAAPPPPEPEP